MIIVCQLCLYLAPERLKKKEKELVNATLQLLRLKKVKLKIQREKVLREVATHKESENMEDELEKIEKKFFRKQIEIYDICLKIIEEEEKLYRLELKQFLKDDSNNEESDEEDLFFDSFQEQPAEFENEQELIQFFQEKQRKTTPKKEEKGADWHKKRDIVEKLNRCYRKKAWLRINKVIHLSYFTFPFCLRNLSSLFGFNVTGFL